MIAFISDLRWIHRTTLGLFLLALSGASLTAQGEAERITLDARKELASLEAKGDALKVGDKNGARRILQRLRIVNSKLSSAKDKRHPDWVDAAKRFNALQTSVTEKGNGTAARPAGTADPATLEALRARRRRRATRAETHVGVGVRGSGVRAEVEAARGRASPTSTRPLPQVDRSVKNVGVTITSLERMIESGVATLAKNQGAAALKAEMQAMLRSYRSAARPRPSSRRHARGAVDEERARDDGAAHPETPGTARRDGEGPSRRQATALERTVLDRGQRQAPAPGVAQPQCDDHRRPCR